MKSIRLLCVLLALSPFTLIGCGDDSDNGNADAKAYVASCEKLCAAQDAKKCDTGAFAVTVDDCKGFCQFVAGATGDCAAKYKAYGECTDKAEDACTAETTCSSQQEAATNACKQ
ncbi:MAG TPA: hypothetical protein VIV60_05890 [Polyangiaceae bacterium]